MLRRDSVQTGPALDEGEPGSAAGSDVTSDKSLSLLGPQSPGCQQCNVCTRALMERE